MLNPFRSPEPRRAIDAGRVCCPLAERDAESDFCLQCPWAHEVRLEGEAPFVRCRPPARLLLIP
jgi:hypothetical protein